MIISEKLNHEEKCLDLLFRWRMKTENCLKIFPPKLAFFFSSSPNRTVTRVTKI